MCGCLWVLCDLERSILLYAGTDVYMSSVPIYKWERLLLEYNVVSVSRG